MVFSAADESSPETIERQVPGRRLWIGWDPTVVRVLYVLVSLLSAAFPGILVYLVLWLVMPPPE